MKNNGYSFKAGKNIYMVRCHKCARENYAPAVATGICAFCGYKATKKDLHDK